MDASVKLTKPQKLALMEIVRYAPQPWSPTYKPALRLVELGFAKWIDGGFSNDMLRPTEAGKKFYEEITSQ